MKRSLLLVAALMCFTAAGLQAQKKLSIDKVYSTYLRSSGTINENDQIKGYFFLYQSDRIDKKTNEYTLQVLDQNLNKVKDIVFKDTKNVYLLEASYNGNSIAFLFKNNDTKALEMKIYGMDATLKHTYTREINKRTEQIFTMHEMMRMISEEATMTRNSYDVGQNGYATLYPTKDGHQSTYELSFYSSKEKKEWTYSPTDDDERYAAAEYLGSSGDLLLLEVLKKSSTFSGKVTSHIVGVNMLTGKKEFAIDNKNDLYTMVPSGITAGRGKNEILVTGTYFDKDAKLLKDYSKGLAVYSIDTKGTVLSKTYTSWSDDFGKFIPVNKKGRIDNVGYLFIHKIIQSPDGKLFVVGEGYKKQAGKFAVTDMVVMEFNIEYKLSNATIYEKITNSEDLFPGNGNPHLLAMELNSFGSFDYAFTTGEADNSTFSICYTELQKGREEKAGSFNSIHYNGNKFSTDKLQLRSKASIMRVFPAKAGSIMIMEYFKKDKRLDFRLEKLG